MYIVWFHRYDRLGCNLVCYIAQILYAYHHGYYIKIIDNELNYPKYPNSKFYIMLLDYINNILREKIYFNNFLRAPACFLERTISPA